MSVRIGNGANGMRGGGWRVRMGRMTCIAAGVFLLSLSALGIGAQTPAAGESSQSAAPVDTPAGTRDRKSDEKPADNVSEQQKRLAEDKARLLKLAIELKREIDKAGTVTLSAQSLRKADEIEKLARSIRQAMNRDPGPSH